MSVETVMVEEQSLAARTAEVSIVIPALNEEAAIGDVVRGLKERFPQAELIVVNDGSTDATPQRAREAGATVIDHDRCRGYGSALRTGTREAQRPYVLFCDADGQHQAEDVERLIVESEGYDLVIGKRGADSHAPLARRPGKLVLKWFANFLAGETIPDLNSGLRIVRREVMLQYLHLMPPGFSFSTTSTFAMLKSNRRIKYVPITVKERLGKSTVSQLRHGPQTIMLMLRLTVLFEPLKVFNFVAAFLFLLCLVSVGIDVSFSGGGLGDTTVLLGISSLMVFMFGLLCDQVAAIRREKHE